MKIYVYRDPPERMSPQGHLTAYDKPQSLDFGRQFVGVLDTGPEAGSDNRKPAEPEMVALHIYRDEFPNDPDGAHRYGVTPDARQVLENENRRYLTMVEVPAMEWTRDGAAAEPAQPAGIAAHIASQGRLATIDDEARMPAFPPQDCPPGEVWISPGALRKAVMEHAGSSYVNAKPLPPEYAGIWQACCLQFLKTVDRMAKPPAPAVDEERREPARDEFMRPPADA